MDTFWGLGATGWTAIYTLITAGLLLAAVAAAFYAKRQIDEAQRANRETTRPYVIVTIESTGTSRQLFDLCIRNIGQRPALNVRIALDPPPVSADPIEGHEIANVKMLTQPVAMIAPAQEMRAYFDDHRERHRVKNLPTSHQVTVEYEDSSGYTYKEASVLDIDAMRGAVYVEEKTIHHVAKSLDDIKKTLNSASVLKCHGDISVDAVIEEFTAHEERKETEEYERALSDLIVYREQGVQGREVTRAEKVVSDFEHKYANRAADDTDEK